jgi:hypothetical protein
VGVDRANGCHYSPGWITGLWLTLGLVALLFVGACRHGAAVTDRQKRPAAKGTVTAPPSAPAVPPAKASRPRGPAYRVDNGLGAPMA